MKNVTIRQLGWCKSKILIESSELEGMDTIDTSSVAALMLLLGARVWSSSGLPAILLSLIKQE